MISTNYSPHVEISLDNLIHNVNQIRSIIPAETAIIAVVKDNAYGCGSIPVAQTLEQYGKINYFAVARPEEAFALRENGIKSSILVLGRATADQVSKGTAADITFTLNDFQDFEIWLQSKCEVRFHCNIDTAMHRLGLLPSDMVALIERLSAAKRFILEGVFTHLANADEPNTATVETQRKLLLKCIEQLRIAGIKPRHVHYGNSAGVMCFQMKECTLVRPGIALYGCKPDPNKDFRLDLRPILSLKGPVVKIKKVPVNTPVSYGGHYVTTKETFIATVAIGYAHGLPRFLGNKGSLLINGKQYLIAGNVTMDYVMVDVGPDPAIKVGDEAVAIGFQKEIQISPDDIAKLGNTISYEILCNISTAIDRFYLFNDSIVLDKKCTIY